MSIVLASSYVLFLCHAEIVVVQILNCVEETRTQYHTLKDILYYLYKV
jgi:hypothetical protein